MAGEDGSEVEGGNVPKQEVVDTAGINGNDIKPAKSNVFIEAIRRARMSIQKRLGKEQAADGEKKPIQSIRDANEVPILQEVGKKLGISIDVLAREGEKYENEIPDEPHAFTEAIRDEPVMPSGRVYRGTVPEGEVYIRFNNPPDEDLQEFWDEVRKKKAASKPQ